MFHREQRFTGICIHILIGFSVFLTGILQVSSYSLNGNMITSQSQSAIKKLLLWQPFDDTCEFLRLLRLRVYLWPSSMASFSTWAWRHWPGFSLSSASSFSSCPVSHHFLNLHYGSYCNSCGVFIQSAYTASLQSVMFLSVEYVRE